MKQSFLTQTLIRNWQKISLTTILIWLISAIIILIYPSSYRAHTLVVPAETTGIAISSILAPNLTLSPTFIDPKPSGNFAVYLGALRTREMATALRLNTSLADALTAEARAAWLGRLREGLGFPITPPDDDAILAWLEKNTSATPLPNSILWQIEVRHPSPTMALSVLQTLHATAESRVRDEIAALLSRRLIWLMDRAGTEADSLARAALYDLISQANRHSAIVSADTNVAARVVSAPAVESQPTVPNKPFLLAIAIIPALGLATLISLLQELLKLDQTQILEIRSYPTFEKT